MARLRADGVGPESRRLRWCLAAVCASAASIWLSLRGLLDAGPEAVAARLAAAPLASPDEAARGPAQAEGDVGGEQPARGAPPQQEAPGGAPRQAGALRGGPAGPAARDAHYYTVCNDMSSQMLGHVANIAFAISGRKPVMIPDVFILDGTQTHPFSNVLPMQHNVIPLDVVFDTEVLLQKIAAFGIEAKILPHDVSHDRLNCTWLSVLQSAEVAVAKDVLKAMVPSKRARVVLDSIQAAVFAHLSKGEELLRTNTGRFSMSSAVCLHHPDGDDWDKHCNHLERLSEANTNCRSSEPFSDLVRHRTSHLQGAWIFYVGDHEIGADLQALSEEASMPVVTREQVLPASSGVMRRFTRDESVSREVGAALDYFLCSQMPVFIGNSVSPWSASQIVIRDTVASWYNSFGIPLADVFRAYTIPLVYTYTEESSPTGKVLLQISILSVKRVMPTASIHILYHGSGDGELRGWLTQHGVVLYDHRPTWRDQIEQMRLKGNRLASHLYANAGNYLGTWQRIDIPQFLSVEYCILLDSDAFVVRAFTIADIGHSIPRGLAFSSELNEDDGQPSNAGVALLNVPFLRESVERFHAFVVNHGDPNFARGPSDQGAYMEFYENDLQFLSTRFNMKPYYKNAHNWDTRFILHYHGLKPSDHIKYWFSGICEPLQCFLIFLFEGVPYQCDAMVDFAKAAAFEGPGLIRQYCDLSTSNYSDLCTGLLGLMADHGLPGRTCAAYCERALAQRGLNPADFPYRH